MCSKDSNRNFKNKKKYAPVERPKCKMTLVNNIYYSMKLYHVITAIVKNIYVKPKSPKKYFFHEIDVGIANMNVTQKSIFQIKGTHTHGVLPRLINVTRS